MRNPGGYGYAFAGSEGPLALRFDGWQCVASSPAGVVEVDTFSCFHCNSVVYVRPKMDPADMGGLCKLCMKLICKYCYDKGNCDPLEEKLRRSEDRDRFRRSLEL